MKIFCIKQLLKSQESDWLFQITNTLIIKLWDKAIGNKKVNNKFKNYFEMEYQAFLKTNKINKKAQVFKIKLFKI